MGDLSDIGKDGAIQRKLAGLGFSSTVESVRTSKGKRKYAKKGCNIRWTSAMEDFIIDNYLKYPPKKCIALFNEKFGVKPTPQALAMRASMLKINHKWTPEMEDFVKQHYSELGLKETTKRFNEFFNCAKSQKAIAVRAGRLGVAPKRNYAAPAPVQESVPVASQEVHTESEISFPVRKKRKNVFLRIYDAIFNQ